MSKEEKLTKKILIDSLYDDGEINEEQFKSRIDGWLGYAKFGDSFNLLKRIIPT